MPMPFREEIFIKCQNVWKRFDWFARNLNENDMAGGSVKGYCVSRGFWVEFAKLTSLLIDWKLSSNKVSQSGWKSIGWRAVSWVWRLPIALNYFLMQLKLFSAVFSRRVYTLVPELGYYIITLLPSNKAYKLNGYILFLCSFQCIKPIVIHAN